MTRLGDFAVIGYLGDVMLLAHFHDVLAVIGFPQNADLLFGRVLLPFIV